MKYKVPGILFLCIIICTGIALKVSDTASGLLRTFLEASFSQRDAETEKEELTAALSEELGKTDEDLLSALPYKNQMIEMNGFLLKELGVRSYYNLKHSMNITADGYNVTGRPKTSTDYEVEQTLALKEYLDSKGINLLYVNEPAKYIDDSFYMEEFGGESYLNRNADLFLSRISEAGVECLDLRDCIRDEDLDPLSLFYRTDHHWTVPASKWAAGKIAEKLNESFGYEIDLSLYDSDRFNEVHYENAWLGEQGRKVSKAYIGLDDYTMLEPLYDTSFKVIKSKNKNEAEGDFTIFIDKSDYEPDEDFYSARSWHYSYQFFTGKTVQNNNAKYGNILLLGDSYERSMAPFLSLGVAKMREIVPRSCKKSIREYIEGGNYDTVIMAYAQFMIGAHDNEKSVNYKMFKLD